MLWDDETVRKHSHTNTCEISMIISLIWMILSPFWYEPISFTKDNPRCIRFVFTLHTASTRGSSPSLFYFCVFLLLLWVSRINETHNNNKLKKEKKTLYNNNNNSHRPATKCIPIHLYIFIYVYIESLIKTLRNDVASTYTLYIYIRWCFFFVFFVFTFIRCLPFNVGWYGFDAWLSVVSGTLLTKRADSVLTHWK